jgi:hypothetical protein
MPTIGMRLAKRLLCAAIVAAVAGFAAPALAATYIDTSGIHELKPEERIAISDPKPVQLLFQFQTNDAANGRATQGLKQAVVDAVKASGLFSEVVDGPAAGGAILSVTINDVFDKKSVESHGFLTGLTFGLAGTVVTDHYICTVEYVSGGADAPKVTKTVEHNIFSTLGLKSAPPNAEKVDSLDTAAFRMLREVIGNALNGLAADCAFNPNAPAQAVTAPAAPPAPTTAPPPDAVTPDTAPAPAAAPATPAPPGQS